MAGLAFLLHFGAFHLLSCGWRAAGADAKPLMDWPIRSTSLAEFWGRRWNTAFRDLAHRFVFRPLAARLGPRAGLAAGFLASGLVHDLVISVPAGGGYGGPTAHFALQGLGLLAERSALGRAAGLGRGWRGRAFAALVVVGPAGLLFHPPFVRAVVLPFLDVIGAV
jgi:alginate O-acetyltransferase complex protein AlgI